MAGPLVRWAEGDRPGTPDGLGSSPGGEHRCSIAVSIDSAIFILPCCLPLSLSPAYAFVCLLSFSLADSRAPLRSLPLSVVSHSLSLALVRVTLSVRLQSPSANPNPLVAIPLSQVSPCPMSPSPAPAAGPRPIHPFTLFPASTSTSGTAPDIPQVDASCPRAAHDGPDPHTASSCRLSFPPVLVALVLAYPRF